MPSFIEQMMHDSIEVNKFLAKEEEYVMHTKPAVQTEQSASEALREADNQLSYYERYATPISDVVGMNKDGRSTFQDWVLRLPFMQQAVLAAGIRAMDGWEKLHGGKHMMRWFRRAAMISSFEGYPLLTPYGAGGGSFTGSAPTGLSMQAIADMFLNSRDAMELHYFAHMMHAFQIVAYKHSDAGIRGYFYYVYERMAHSLHLWPESQEHMDKRLGDNIDSWQARADEALTCSD